MTGYRSYARDSTRYVPRTVVTDPPRRKRRRPFRTTAAVESRGLSDDAKARVRAAYEALGLRVPKEAM